MSRFPAQPFAFRDSYDGGEKEERGRKEARKKEEKGRGKKEGKRGKKRTGRGVRKGGEKEKRRGGETWMERAGIGERRGKKEEAEGWSQREMGRREKDLNGKRGNRGKEREEGRRETGRRRRRREGGKRIENRCARRGTCFHPGPDVCQDACRFPSQPRIGFVHRTLRCTYDSQFHCTRLSPRTAAFANGMPGPRPRMPIRELPRSAPLHRSSPPFAPLRSTRSAQLHRAFHPVSPPAPHPAPCLASHSHSTARPPAPTGQLSLENIMLEYI